MKTFKNAAAQKDTITTNILFAQGDAAPSEPGDWVECDELDLDFSGAEHLHTIAGVRYFGSL